MERAEQERPPYYLTRIKPGGLSALMMVVELLQERGEFVEVSETSPSEEALGYSPSLEGQIIVHVDEETWWTVHKVVAGLNLAGFDKHAEDYEGMRLRQALEQRVANLNGYEPSIRRDVMDPEKYKRHKMPYLHIEVEKPKK